ATYGVGDNYASSDKGWITGLAITQYTSLSLFALTWGVGAYQARINMTSRLNSQVVQPSALLRDPGLTLSAGTGLALTLEF
ncbi:MAG: hypothetical protein H7Z43_00405, partial [Clostridia bacterium]|nr:hypothetical protein [Deltaproteobacteria bacterium]